MTSIVREIMSPDPITCPESASIVEAARLMRDEDIGDVLVTSDGGRLVGIVTDRDLVVRCLAEDAASNATVGQACSGDLAVVSPDSDVRAAMRLMQERALRRLPVVDDGRVVGIVSLGDVAIEHDADSALSAISAAEPNS